MNTTHFYTVTVDWTSERKGIMSAEGLPSLEVATPPEFDGHPGIWTPEHLFAASINACFMATFLAIANFSKLNFVSFHAETVGKLEKVEGVGLNISEAIIKAHLVVRQESEVEKATRILEKAKKNCLISNSIKTSVNLMSKVEWQA